MIGCNLLSCPNCEENLFLLPVIFDLVVVGVGGNVLTASETGG